MVEQKIVDRVWLPKFTLLRGPEVGQQSDPILVFPDLLKNELDKYNLKPIKIGPIILTTSGLMIKYSNF